MVNKQEYKNRFVDIIVNAFEHNPSVVDVVKQDHKKDIRIRKLAEYSYEFGKRRNGLYMSKDGNGIAILYVEDLNRTLADHWADVKLALQVVGLKRIRYLLAKEAYRKKVRPSEPFFYVWFLGVDAAYRGTQSIKDLKQKIFAEADRLQLPILLETTIEQNRRVYEYFGFKVYHQHRFHENMPTTYFMRREAIVS